MKIEEKADETLHAWNLQLESVRQRQLSRGDGKAGLASRAQVAGKTGLEVMTALLDNVNIVRAANLKTGPLRCIGTALHVGRQVGTSEAKIVGPDGKLYAHATTTCVIFDAA